MDSHVYVTNNYVTTICSSAHCSNSLPFELISLELYTMSCITCFGAETEKDQHTKGFISVLQIHKCRCGKG